MGIIQKWSYWKPVQPLWNIERPSKKRSVTNIHERSVTSIHEHYLRSFTSIARASQEHCKSIARASQEHCRSIERASSIVLTTVAIIRIFYKYDAQYDAAEVSLRVAATSTQGSTRHQAKEFRIPMLASLSRTPIRWTLHIRWISTKFDSQLLAISM